MTFFEKILDKVLSLDKEYLDPLSTNNLAEFMVNNSENFMNIRIPMVKNNRSMNLSNSVAVILYEAWRQNNFNEGI